MGTKKWTPFQSDGIRIDPKILSPEDMKLDIEDLLDKLDALGFKYIKKLKKLSKEIYPLKQEHQEKKSAWIIKGTRNKKVYAWYLEYSLEYNLWKNATDYRAGNSYRTTPLKTALKGQGLDSDLLYKEICNTWRQLVDVRFKLLALLPIVSITVIINIINSEMYLYGKLLVCMMGLIFTFGIRIYDKRNTELYDQLIGRGRKMEEEQGIDNGLFMGRKGSGNYYFFGLKIPFTKIQHDTGLRVIYGTCYLAWIAVIVILTLMANGF